MCLDSAGYATYLASMRDKAPIQTVIDSWPTLSAFARDAGVTYGAAKQMRRRGLISVACWHVLAASDGAKGLGVTLERLAELHYRAPAQEAQVAA